MKQGSRVKHKLTGELGTIELVLAPGLPNCAVVVWDGQMEGYYIVKTDLEPHEEEYDRDGYVSGSDGW